MMEVFHPTPVLPSNAPPWAGEGSEPSQLHILAEPSSQRQLGCLPSQRCISPYSPDDVSDHEDYATSAALESRLARGVKSLVQSYPSGYGYDRRYPVVSNVRYGHHSQRVHEQRHRHPSETSESRDERKQEATARRLAAMFAKCDGYIKYRNRQPKDGKGRDGQKWPDHMEDAFLRALVRWPPVGRKKQIPRPGAKAMGRNELVADYIIQATGEIRTRKQVSSHIQVLRPFVQDEPDIMYYLSEVPTKDISGRHAATLAKRHASMYPVRAHRHFELERRTKQQVDLKSTLNLELDEFKMYMRTPASANPPLSTLHEYTSYDSYGRGGQMKAICIQNKAHLYQSYPELTDVQFSRLLNSTVIAMEASLTLHDFRKIQEQASSEDIELAISFAFQGPVSFPAPNILCRTHVYRNSHREEEIDLKTGKPKPTAWDRVDVTPTQDADGHTRNQYVVKKFRSNFWATTIWSLARDQQAASTLAARGPAPGETLESHQAAVKSIQDSVSDTIGSITAVQEFIATTDNHTYQAILTVHWRFRQAFGAELGSTSWRDIIVPSNLGAQTTVPSTTLEFDYSAPTATFDSFDSDLSVMPGSFRSGQAAESTGYHFPFAHHNMGLSTLQSPISFSPTTQPSFYNEGLTSEDAYNGVWTTTGDIIPSTTILEVDNLSFTNATNFAGTNNGLSFANEEYRHPGVTSAVHSQDFFEAPQGYSTSQDNHREQHHELGLDVGLDHASGMTDPALLGSLGHSAAWGGSFDGGWLDGSGAATGDGAIGASSTSHAKLGHEFDGFDIPRASMMALPAGGEGTEVVMQEGQHQDIQQQEQQQQQQRQQRRQYEVQDHGFGAYERHFSMSFRSEAGLRDGHDHGHGHHQAFPGAEGVGEQREGEGEEEVGERRERLEEGEHMGTSTEDMHAQRQTRENNAAAQAVWL